MLAAGPVYTPVTRFELSQLGARLYGHPTRWRTKLANDSGYAIKTIDAYADGLRRIPRRAEVLFLAMLRDHNRDLDELLA